jgi:hypothetical protein
MGLKPISDEELRTRARDLMFKLRGLDGGEKSARTVERLIARLTEAGVFKEPKPEPPRWSIHGEW